MGNITSSPLCWPPGRVRTQARDRKSANFGQRNDRGYGRSQLTLAQASRRVQEELDRFTKSGNFYRTSDIIISTNLAVRNDGFPRSGQRKPDDPGVAVYFNLDGKQRCIPCDNYLRIEDNLAAVAATIEALRTIERHGSEMFEAAFTGFTALPGPDHIAARSWRDIIDYYGVNIDEAQLAYKRARKAAHPDYGGTPEQFIEVEQAMEMAKTELLG